jgi:2,5-diketo-D-gluconate reductase A
VQAGFRNFFSSVLAGNQNGFGEAVAASPIPRSELFICGSVNTGSGACSGFDDCKTQTAAGCAQNLQAIAVPQLDMIMLDYPASDCPSIQGQWAAFEDMLSANQTKSLAVSNFNLDQLKCITSNASATVPAVNQVGPMCALPSRTQDSTRWCGRVCSGYGGMVRR